VSSPSLEKAIAIYKTAWMKYFTKRSCGSNVLSKDSFTFISRSSADVQKEVTSVSLLQSQCKLISSSARKCPLCDDLSRNKPRVLTDMLESEVAHTHPYIVARKPEEIG